MSSKERKRHAMEQVSKVEAVLRRWDPIGVLPGESASADEYDSYAPHIVSLIQRGGSMEQLLAHLSHLRTEAMGMPANSELDKQAAKEIVRARCRRLARTLAPERKR